MAARIKSLVTVREEKVFGSVDMNRLMTAGMASGFVYGMCRIIPIGLLQIPVIIFSFFFFIWLTGKKGGVLRYMVFIYSWQGRLMIAARRNPNSLAGRIASLAGWTTSDVIINGDNLFTASIGISLDHNMAGLEILETDSFDAGGFEIVTDDDLFMTIDVTQVKEVTNG